ncbi:MAG: glycosyltransferase family 4 protein [Thermoguttaceae bacterium]|nr:glycosyltransferase family 4 protein [Thermoguttaceae bacterium]
MLNEQVERLLDLRRLLGGASDGQNREKVRRRERLLSLQFRVQSPRPLRRVRPYRRSVRFRKVVLPPKTRRRNRRYSAAYRRFEVPRRRQFAPFFNVRQPVAGKGPLFLRRNPPRTRATFPGNPNSCCRKSSEARTLANLYALQQVDDLREFYRQTRILLAPSLWNESFGRVAVEAGLNGIPVVCSNRGALPEVVEGWGITLDVPPRYTPSTRTIPTPDEVAPWGDAVATLWNDDVYAQENARVARERVERYSFQNVAQQTVAFFNDVVSR